MEEKVFMKGYKAFGPGLVCAPNGIKFQYAENTVFEMEEDAKVCERGFHFCAAPLDVLDYYPLVNCDGTLSEFAEVEALDKCVTDDMKKYATKKIRIGAKLEFAQFVKAAVEFECVSAKDKDSGGNAKLASSGDSAQLASSGCNAQLASSGGYAKLASSGNYAQLASSGNSAQLASSGNYAQLASSGGYAKLASSGDSAQLASSGNSAQLASSGDSAQLASSGDNSVICCAGNNCSAKAKKGSWITLSEWKHVSGEYVPVCVKTERVDGIRIKEDVFYRLEDGEFVEVED